MITWFRGVGQGIFSLDSGFKFYKKDICRSNKWETSKDKRKKAQEKEDAQKKKKEAKAKKEGKQFTWLSEWMFYV